MHKDQRSGYSKKKNLNSELVVLRFKVKFLLSI